jgi:hypothetical protein
MLTYKYNFFLQYKKIVYPFLKDVRGHCTMYCTPYMYVQYMNISMHAYTTIRMNFCTCSIILSTMKHNFSTMYSRYRRKVIDIKTGNRIMRYYLLPSCIKLAEESRAGIFTKSMGARNRGGIGLSYRPARLHRLAEFIPWNQFRGPINI